MQKIVDEESWALALEEADSHDFYHTYHYHELNRSTASDRAVLYVFRHSTGIIALPLMLRPISSGVQSDSSRWDATSVYGYAGPAYSNGLNLEAAGPAFREALCSTLRAEDLVSVFARLHPILRNEQLVKGVGAVVHGGWTVAVDLTESEEVQKRYYSSNHRRGVKKLLKAGITCELTERGTDFDAFARIYTETMARVNASDGYFFDNEYFEKLLACPDFEMHLFVCRKDVDVIAGGLYSSCNGIVQYHLGGTASEALSMAPSKLLMDTVRSWACATGHKVFHLGGGLGGQKDNLYAFKRGFAKNGELEGRLWRWIVDPAAYAQLTVQSGLDAHLVDSHETGTGYFPAYRSPGK